jgi:hypothetical protein
LIKGGIQINLNISASGDDDNSDDIILQHPIAHYLLVTITDAASLAVSKIKRLVLGFPQQQPGFKPGLSHVGFVVD